MNITNFYSNLVDATKSGKSPYVIESSQGAYLTVGGRKLLNFCSSHYLGLAVNDRVKDATKKAIDQYGLGTGYRTIAGTHKLHIQLEKALADFKHAKDAIVFSSGYLANCAAIQTIIGKEDIVISDELNHASIIDAIRLSQVKNKLIYKHLDTKDLKAKLDEASKIAKVPKSDGELPLILIVTDGVFSMDGDLSPLPEISKIAKQYEALVMVDDAHGEGVMGDGGRGVVEHFGLSGQIDIEVGTLSKAFSVMGGYITGRKELIQYYKQKARQFLFSIALTIPDAAAALEGVKILSESDDLVKKLWENTNYLKEKFQKLGFDTGQSKSPITPVMLQEDDLTLKFSSRLLEEGVFAGAIRFPMVPKGTARIRVIPSASHSKKDLDFGINIFEKVGRELGAL